LDKTSLSSKKEDTRQTKNALAISVRLKRIKINAISVRT